MSGPGTHLERDPVVEAYKAGVDRTLIREHLAARRRSAPTTRRADAVRRGAPRGRRLRSARAVTDVAGLLRALADGGVACILVGGVAAPIHGSARLTRDIDVVYSRGRPSLSWPSNSARGMRSSAKRW